MPVDCEGSANTQQSSFSKGILFLRSQQRDWNITVVRTSFERLAYQIVFPYLSIYIVALGATVTQLSIVNSIGMITAGILGPLTGWVIDRSGPKRIYLFGIGLLGISYLTYGVAQSWVLTIIAMAAYWVGYSISIHGCATVCGNCLTNEDRATGMTICETVCAGLLGMAGPMIGAWLVTLFGGITTSGIRPLFFLSLIITMGTFWPHTPSYRTKAGENTDHPIHSVSRHPPGIEGRTLLKTVACHCGSRLHALRYDLSFFSGVCP
jgi:MFS family permease